jgi:glutamine amidotransferase
MKVAVIKYNAGNIGSVRNALRREGVEPVVTDDADELLSADKVIFPGVGEASGAMNDLRAKGLDVVIPELTRPVLGICLGMQLLCASTDESDTACLGVVPARVRKFSAQDIKVPHTGWNTISELKGPLFRGVEEESYLYFVHGFFVEDCAESAAVCDYGGRFSAAIQSRNFYATQFHPEKSGTVGERILSNFLNLKESL